MLVFGFQHSQWTWRDSTGYVTPVYLYNEYKRMLQITYLFSGPSHLCPLLEPSSLTMSGTCLVRWSSEINVWTWHKVRPSPRRWSEGVKAVLTGWEISIYLLSNSVNQRHTYHALNENQSQNRVYPPTTAQVQETWWRLCRGILTTTTAFNWAYHTENKTARQRDLKWTNTHTLILLHMHWQAAKRHHSQHR